MSTLRSLSVAVALCGALSAQTLILPSSVGSGDGAGSNAFPWDRDAVTPGSNDMRQQCFYDE